MTAPAEDKVAGTITSAAWSAELGAWVALGYLHRNVEAPGPVRVRSGDGVGGSRPVRAELLPLVGTTDPERAARNGRPVPAAQHPGGGNAPRDVALLAAVRRPWPTRWSRPTTTAFTDVGQRRDGGSRSSALARPRRRPLAPAPRPLERGTAGHAAGIPTGPGSSSSPPSSCGSWPSTPPGAAGPTTRR